MRHCLLQYKLPRRAIAAASSAAFAFLSVAIPVAACLWDRDTPVDEARGLPEVVAVLTGRFVRNPPVYYEMRLKRVAGLLDSDPGQLDAYDDAGVACDRLGRGDEAIAWMEKKRARLDGLDRSDRKVNEDWYRLYANLGTFRVHRWIRMGADRSRIAEVKQARAEIAQAIEINPEAHFGREKYQLMAMDWMIEPPALVKYDNLPNILGLYPNATIDEQAARDAVTGLSGLVVLGNAWESVDVFQALAHALSHYGKRNTLAYLAWLRCIELIDQGRGSILPEAPRGDELKKILFRPDFTRKDNLLDEAYPRLRAEAEAWHQARTAFMLERLQSGRHPDTDRTFWEGYHEPPPPLLPSSSVAGEYAARQEARRRRDVVILIAILVVVLGLPCAWWIRRGKRSKPYGGPEKLE